LRRHDAVDDVAVSAYPALVDGIAIDLASHDPVELGDVGGEVLRVRDLCPCHAQKFVPLVPQNPAQLVIDFEAAFSRRSVAMPNSPRSKYRRKRSSLARRCS